MFKMEIVETESEQVRPPSMGHYLVVTERATGCNEMLIKRPRRLGALPQHWGGGRLRCQVCGSIVLPQPQLKYFKA
jgi:hypothetical protein